MKIGVRESALSFAIFGGVVFALMSVDRTYASGWGRCSPAAASRVWVTAQAIGGVLWTALRTQSIENAPMVVFATVGVVLTLFMLEKLVAALVLAIEPISTRRRSSSGSSATG